MPLSATFAIPGDIETLTGGYIYEKQLRLALRRIGWDVGHLQLPGGFPDPSEAEIGETATALAALPSDHPVILDGFLTGAMPPDRLAALAAPFVAVTHHPLAYETGLALQRAAYLKDVERANLARAAHVIVPSPHTASILIKDFDVAPDHVTVAPPGVIRSPARETKASAVPEILTVGQLVPRKGHDTLLYALGGVSDLDWTACLIGREADAEHGRYLRDLSVRLGIDERVHFLGEVAPEALSAQYGRASVFALATHYEGYGMVFSEAMVHGLPIISCTGGAVPETVPAEAGLLVPVGDAKAFADALRRVLTDSHLRQSLAAGSARHGRRLPGWDDTARIVSDVLRELAPQV